MKVSRRCMPVKLGSDMHVSLDVEALVFYSAAISPRNKFDKFSSLLHRPLGQSVQVAGAQKILSR